MQKEEKDIRDIYQTDDQNPEQDFNPRSSQQHLESHRRELRKNRLVLIFFGSLTVVFSVALVSVMIRHFVQEFQGVKKAPEEKPADTPEQALDAGSLWIMDYPPEPENPDEKPGPKPLSASWVKTAAYYIISGQMALNFARNEEANDFFKKVVDIYPDIKGVYFTIGQLYLLRNEYQQAIHYLEKSLQEEETVDVVNALGNAYLGAEQFAPAEKNLKRALELLPENAGCHRSLANLYRKMKRDNDAVYHFEKYIDAKPDDLDTRQEFALYLTKLGRWKNAEEVLTELIKEVADVAPLYFLLAQTQIQSSQPDKAVETLKKGVQLLDPQTALIWLKRDEFNGIRGTAGFKDLVNQLGRK
ncbi:MAG: tetratricopeptide repeat protein [Pontiellaceae bacterium]|jgi:tetratricopeptide (TPR) repeat protein|nr:tetratricopeptide repeat protein [Pontiellaceae bacterium]